MLELLRKRCAEMQVVKQSILMPFFLKALQKTCLDCCNRGVFMHLVQVLLYAGGLHRHDILICRPELEGLQRSCEPAARHEESAQHLHIKRRVHLCMQYTAGQTCSSDEKLVSRQV